MFFNFNKYITPKEAKKLGDARSIMELEELANSDSECDACNNPAWKYGGTGLCFSCTTGETDASEDYELKPQ